jgi:hypothetical protein
MDNCGTELALCDRSRTRLSGRIVRYLLQNTPKPFPYLLVTDRGAARGHSLQAPILIRRASVKFVVLSWNSEVLLRISGSPTTTLSEGRGGIEQEIVAYID